MVQSRVLAAALDVLGMCRCREGHRDGAALLCVMHDSSCKAQGSVLAAALAVLSMCRESRESREKKKTKEERRKNENRTDKSSKRKKACKANLGALYL